MWLNYDILFVHQASLLSMLLADLYSTKIEAS